MRKGKQQLLESIRYVPSTRIEVSKIKFDENNPNKLSNEKINGLEKIMKDPEVGNAVEVWINDNGDGTYLCIDGEHRLKVLLKNNVKFVWAKIFKVSYTKVRILRQVANKLHGIHDKRKDADEFRAIFEDEKLEDFAEFLGEPIENFQRELEKAFDDISFDVLEEDIPAPPAKPKSKPGDIYQLGNHRIMCGDCTDAEAVKQLLKDKTVDQLATDPPYGVDYAKKNDYLNRFDRGNRIQKAYANDERERDYVEFFSKFLSVIPFSAYNTIYIFMSGKHYRDLLESTEKSQMFHGTDLVWVKNNHVLGPSDYLPKHELCYYGWKGKHKFYGGRGKQTTVLEYDKPHINDLHPTMKPVEMFCQIIRDGSKKEMLVYEPFLGSGTTLIAAEQTGRICYGMELDPAYVDVEITRWENLTGKKAKLITRVKK